MAERSKAAAAQIDQLASGAQATSAEAVLAIERRGAQLDDWMSMTRALADKSDEVEPAATQHQADTHVANRMIQILAQKFQLTALDAREIAAAASALALSATDMDVTGPEGRR
jgi:methyl-accepting chemotaxis protein